MSIGRIGSAGADSAWVVAATDPAAGGTSEVETAASDVSLDEVAEGMVEADREQRIAARAARRALAEAARGERQAAIRAQREAASDVFGSAIVQAVLGGVTAVAQGVAAIGAAGTAAAIGEGAAAAATVSAPASAGVPWHRWVQIGADLLPHTVPLFDEPARRAEADRLRAQEHTNEAGWLDDQARLAGDDAEAARAAERSHAEALSRAADLVEQGRSIAIGREAG